MRIYDPLHINLCKRKKENYIFFIDKLIYMKQYLVKYETHDGECHTERITAWDEQSAIEQLPCFKSIYWVKEQFVRSTWVTDIQAADGVAL